MDRACLSVGLALAIFVLGGCSNIQRVDLSEWQHYTGKDPYTGDDVSHPKSASPSTKTAAARGPGVYVVEVRPSANVGANEPEQRQADEPGPEKRLQEAFQRLCRDC
jgi:hypothetical protein